MAIDLEDEILQDFLVEAGEILEQLNEQLLQLEEAPDDTELLNAIFRGFHTIKGGGGFLALDSLVHVCHGTEDIFNLLRSGDLNVDDQISDVVLQVLDVVNDMFDEIRLGEDPSPASPELLATIQSIASGEVVDIEVTDETADEVVVEGASAATTDDAEPGGDITDQEFEAILDALDGKPPAEKKITQIPVGKDDITDDEFDALLDDIHGAGKHNSAKKSAEKKSTVQKITKAPVGKDDITDDEFDALLDNIHGAGKHSKVKKSTEKKSAEQKITKSPVGKDDISDDEFDALLDDMHGKGKSPTAVHTGDKPAAAPKKAATPAAAKKTATAKKPQAETTVRVDTKRLDDIMNLVGELVLVRNRLNTLKENFDDERIELAIANLDVVTGDLQTSVMKTRMQPVKKVFGRFPRVVRDLARTLKKEVVLEMEGEDTDLDKNLVEALADPMVHLVRNAIDHGIELPDVREQKGKPRQGTCLLSASQEGDHILLLIKDDGAGMDADLLRSIAVEKGLYDEEAAARLDDKECYNLIFAPGFSTKKEISDVSGRGVGMDVVKTRIEQLNGTVEIDAELGKGSVIRIKVPLTLAILPTLMIVVGERKFALPLSMVDEIFEANSRPTNVIDGQKVVLIRGKAPPLFRLRNWLLAPGDNSVCSDEDSQVIMMQVGNQSVGIVVDQVIGQEEVVIKPLGAMLHGLPGIAGSTITGDGNIAIIIDIPGLLKHHA